MLYSKHFTLALFVLVLPFQKALAQTQAVEVEESNDPVTYYNRAVKFEEDGHYEKAARFLRRAVELKPDWAEAYNNLGVVYARSGSYEEAVVALRQAISLRPAYPLAYTNLGRVQTK